jgi:hypothetical protein
MNWGELFTCDDATGRISWKTNRPGRGCVPGGEAGTRAHHGYRAVTVDGKKHYVHRIVWEMAHGPIPAACCIDHIDGDRSNNALSNLRVVTLSLNQRNKKTQRNSPLGIAGVYFRKGSYEVRVTQRHVGLFNDFFEACCARKSAERAQGYHPNHGRVIA